MAFAGHDWSFRASGGDQKSMVSNMTPMNHALFPRRTFPLLTNETSSTDQTLCKIALYNNLRGPAAITDAFPRILQFEY